MAKKDNTEAAPDLFREFGIVQDAGEVAATGDEMSDLFLEAVGMDGREPDPNDPNFWEKHDKIHHHGNFDPETQTCTLREEAENAEKEKDAGDDIGSGQPNVEGLQSPDKRGAEEREVSIAEAKEWFKKNFNIEVFHATCEDDLEYMGLTPWAKEQFKQGRPLSAGKYSEVVNHFYNICKDLVRRFPKMQFGFDSVYPYDTTSLGMGGSSILDRRRGYGYVVIGDPESILKSSGTDSVPYYDMIVRHEIGHSLSTKSISEEFEKVVSAYFIKRHGTRALMGCFGALGDDVKIFLGGDGDEQWEKAKEEMIANAFAMYTAPNYKQGFMPSEIEAFVEKMITEPKLPKQNAILAMDAAEEEKELPAPYYIEGDSEITAMHCIPVDSKRPYALNYIENKWEFFDTEEERDEFEKKLAKDPRKFSLEYGRKWMEQQIPKMKAYWKRRREEQNEERESKNTAPSSEPAPAHRGDTPMHIPECARMIAKYGENWFDHLPKHDWEEIARKHDAEEKVSKTQGGKEDAITGDEATDTTPDLFAEFGIVQDAGEAAVTGDEMSDLFLEAVGMDGREPDPNDPNFWEKHDKIHHHGNFDPETQTCTLREEAENAEKEKDAGDDIGSEQPNVEGLKSPDKRGAEEEEGSAYWEKIDAEYMDAVKRGDIDACAEMVRDAAKKWGAIEDKNSIPMVLYHGNKKGVLLNPNNNDIALFATPSEESAKYFGKLSSLFLKMNNVLKINANGDDWNKIKVPPELREYITRYPLEGKTEAPCDTIAWVAKMKGYDGVIISSVREGSGIVSDDYISLYPVSKTKSADPVTYDDKGNVIPLSKRFQEGNPDIRFSKEEVEAGSAWDAKTRAESEAAAGIFKQCLYGTEVMFSDEAFHGGEGETTRASIISPEMDAAYMDAVKRGDMEACAEMVRDAAEKAGFNIHAYHGTELTYLGLEKPFTQFEEATHFGTKEVAEEVARNRGMGDLDKDKPYVYDVFLKINNPKEVSDVPADWNDTHSEYWWLEIAKAREEGHDGLIYKNQYEDKKWNKNSFVPISPDQIKSADPVVYDDEGNVIPLSKRFDATSKDIRYSIGGIFTGSAADYAKPSLLKVGTGEGSQVYGWGLYGSTERGVAEGYAKAGAESAARHKYTTSINGQEFGSIDTSEKGLAAQAFTAKGDRKSAIKLLEKRIAEVDTGERPTNYVNKIKSAIEILKDPTNEFVRNKSENKKSTIYEQTFFTDRAPGDESHLLKWYEPVSEENAERIDAISRQYDLDTVGEIDKVENNGGTTFFWGGDKLFVQGSKGEVTGGVLYNLLQKHLGSPKASSEFLARAGIDGIKYPVDSYGKDVKDGDKAGWNYVSFRDDNIRVDRKWVDGEQRYFKNSEGKVVGTYDRSTGRLTLYPGAKPKDVVHEFSHGLWQFAEQESAAGRSTLMTKFRTIADSAPQAVKDAVKANYGTDNPNVYLEECFTHEMARQSEGDSAFARAIETPEGRPWYRRAWGVIKSAWNRFASAKKLPNVNVSKMEGMDAAQSAKFILRQLAKGAHFGTVQHTGNGTRKSVPEEKQIVMLLDNQGKTPDLFTEFGVTGDEAIDTTPDLFYEFGINCGIN